MRRPLGQRAAAILTCAILSTALLGNAIPAAAEDMPTFRIEMNNGAIDPLHLEVPANRPFKLEIHNAGTTPAEFESLELRKEKVLGPKVKSFMVIRRLPPGEYKFFDDFHPGSPQAVLISK
jgi:hypothetical protein